MLSRALSLATVMLLIGCFVAAPAEVQAQNLEAGKSPSQIFAGTCTACHKSPRGLLRTVPAGSLPGFLREHYTTSSNMASLLSAFLISNGATDTRYLANQPKQDKDKDKDAKPEAKPAAGPLEQLDRWGRRLRPAAAPPQETAKPETGPQQAAKPDADGSQAEPGHKGRNAKRLARPGEATDTAKPLAKPLDDQAPAQAAGERGPDGRHLSAKQRLSKRGKPGIEEPAKPDATKPDTDNGEAAKIDSSKPDSVKPDSAKSDAAKDEPSKSEPVKEDKPASETAKDEGGKPEGAKPSGEGKSEAARSDTPKAGSGETTVLRADPVPPVTPAPAARPAASTAVPSGTPEPAAGPSAPAAQSAPPAAPAVTASTPPPAPAAPTGPPVPPISQ
ncbi:MAG: hypothetical protein QOE39_357 [Bradyrhizobium sp.]|jgi:hypothetical protein|nr:hypothetical protein [Bradyrhizobium sp.]